MTEKIQVPVEIGGSKAARDVKAIAGEVDKLEKAVDKLTDKTAESTSKWERFRTALGGDIVQPESIAGMAAAYNHLTTAAASAVAAVQSVVHAAGEAEQTQRALAGLGATYDAIQQATAGTVTAQQAFASQQRLVRSGLRISGEELTRTARYARDFARATGQETPEALERLTDALIGGSADELMQFGIRATEGASRARILNDAFRDMERQQRSQSVASRTLSEDTARLGSAFSDAASSMALLASNGLGLQGIISSIGSAVQGLATDLQDVIRIQREAEAGAADRARRERATATFRAAQTEARQAFLERGGRLEDFQRALPPADTINRLNTEQLERAAASLRGRFAGTRSTTALQGVLAAGDQDRLQGRAFGAIGRADTSGLFGVGAGATSRGFEATERAAILADLGGVIREMTGNVAANGRPRRGQTERDRLHSGVDVTTPATRAELRAARAALALALIQQAGAEALVVTERPDPFGVAVQAAFVDRARTQRLDTARAEMEDTRTRTGENVAGRDTRIAAARTAYAEALREQREAEQASTDATRAATQALKDRGDEIARQLRESLDSQLATRITASQRAMQEATTKAADSPGFFDDLTGAGGVRQAELLRQQGEALRGLIREVDTRIEQAREQGAAEAEINALLSQRVGLMSAISQADRERAAVERERLAPMKAYRDEMVNGLSSIGNAFVEAAAAAIEGEEGFAKALQKQLRAVLVALAKQSAVEALKNTAMAVAAFASYNVPGGIAHLKAAGLWAATGVAAGGVAAAIPKPDAAATGEASTRSPSPAQARRGSAADGAQGGPLVLNITVNGALMNEGVEEGIVRALDRAATRGVSPRVLRGVRGMG